MSKSTKRKKWRQTMAVPKPKMTETVRRMRQQHLIDHPDCTYGDGPHFVPPGFGSIGFYMCDPPADLTNHSRCQPPFDHEHPDHFDLEAFVKPIPIPTDRTLTQETVAAFLVPTKGSVEGHA